jgi:hypothetical protein
VLKKDSADAATFLHSEIVLHKADEPRGRSIKINMQINNLLEMLLNSNYS